MNRNLIQKASYGHYSFPKIIGRFNGPGWKVPIRAYFHEFGFDQAFSDLLFPSSIIGIKHLSDVFDKKLNGNVDLNRFNYAITILWGFDGTKMVDLLGYSGLPKDAKEWPGNPEVSSFVFKNGVYQPDNKQITCGDGTIILGIEEQYRRRCDNLSYFLENPPAIDGVAFH